MVSDGVSGWHAALAYAILGYVPHDLPDPARPDVDVLLADLDRLVSGGRAAIDSGIRAADSWPHAVPDGLRSGLGAAQFAALLGIISSRLTVRDQTGRPVVADRPLTPDERRLIADTPPHHGS